MAIVGNGFDINKKSLTRGSNKKKKEKNHFIITRKHSTHYSVRGIQRKFPNLMKWQSQL